MNKLFKKVMVGVSSMILLVGVYVFVGQVVVGAVEPTAQMDGSNIQVTDTRFTSEMTGSGDNLTVYVEDLTEGLSLTGTTDFNKEILVDGSFTGFNLTGDNFTGGNHYEVNYIYNDGGTNQFAGAVVVQGAEAHSVQVTARVLPILSMDLSTNSVDFGELNTSDINMASSIVITGSTNASDGLTISLNSNGQLENENNDTISYSGDNLTNYTDAGDEFYRFALASSGSTSGADLSFDNTTLVGSYNIVNTANSAIASTNAPVTEANFEFTPQAAINTNTAAGNYTDTITFNVTGSF